MLPLPQGLQSSKHLFPAIESGFKQMGWRPEQIVVTTGPGSFTGIRVGVAAAKGLAFAQNLPLFGVCSLYGFVDPAQNHAALIDARVGGAFVLLPGGTPQFIEKEALPEALSSCDAICGPNLTAFELEQKIECTPNPLWLYQNRSNNLEINYLRSYTS